MLLPYSTLADAKSRTSDVKLVFSENFSSADPNFHLLHSLKINKANEICITHLVERVAVLYVIFSFIVSLNHYGYVLHTKHQARCEEYSKMDSI